MQGSFQEYVSGLVLVVAGLVGLTLAFLTGHIVIMAPLGLLCLVVGASLMDGVSWQDWKVILTTIFH